MILARLAVWRSRHERFGKMAVNEEIADELTRHQIRLQRLSNNTVRKVIATLNRSDARIVERLLSEDVSTLSRTRQEKLLRDLRRIVESAYADATGALTIELNALGPYEAEYTSSTIGRVIPVAFETVTPAPEQILAAVNSRPFQGKLLKEVYSELEAGAFRRVRDTIRAGYIEGRTTDQIVRDLIGTKTQGYKDGILETGRRQTEAVVRTAVSHTANTARQYVYEENQDLIKGWQFTATLDSRTSLTCMGLDQKIFPLGKGPMPPRHFNCRSASTPVVKSFRELGFDIDEAPPGVRASMNGEVAADQSYNDWLRKQDTDFQNEVLGEKRGRLFRAGVSVDRFTNRKGDELTLDELRRKESGAFEKAGL